MNSLSEHIISNVNTIKDALIQINNFQSKNLTLLIVDGNNKVLGTLTDGDIRRALLKGASLDSSVSDYMCQHFLYLEEGNFCVETVRKARKLGIELLPLLNENKNIKQIYDLTKIKSILPTEAVIMAGGIGKRLLPLTANKPKPLLLLGNKPILEHNIDHLINYGINKIFITVNYLSEQIVEYFETGEKKGISIEYIYEKEPLGTIGALRNINSFTCDNILLMNSDLFTNINLEHFFLEHVKENSDLTIASIPYTINVPYAVLEKKDNRITSFKEKPVNTKYANAGIYLIKREIIETIPKNKFYNATDLIENLLSQNYKLIDSPIYGYWIDIGQHDDYKKAQELVKHLSDE